MPTSSYMLLLVVLLAPHILLLHTHLALATTTIHGRNFPSLQPPHKSAHGNSMRRTLQRDLDRGRVGKDRGMKIGSQPPSCRGKCRGCMPCNPVQVTMPPSQHHQIWRKPAISGSMATTSSSSSSSSSFRVYHAQGPPSYYNVAWRCRCRGTDYSP